MRILLFLALIFIPSICFADYGVLLDKQTGRIIMSQSNPNPETFKKVMESDCASRNLEIDKVEIKILSDNEFFTLYENTVEKDIKEKDKANKEEKQIKKQELMSKLNLTSSDIEGLRLILK